MRKTAAAPDLFPPFHDNGIEETLVANYIPHRRSGAHLDDPVVSAICQKLPPSCLICVHLSVTEGKFVTNQSNCRFHPKVAHHGQLWGIYVAG